VSGKEQERREKISETLTGHGVTRETRTKISKTLEGHSIAQETREKISQATKNNLVAMANACTVGKSNVGKPSSLHQKYRSGTRFDLGIFVRSGWEANYARYLNWLKKNGQIKNWAYEAETFMFEAIKRGIRSYTPDFKLTENDGSIVFHEVKGYMSPDSKTKLKRMAKYYPDVRIVIINSTWFKANKSLKGIIGNWE